MERNHSRGWMYSVNGEYPGSGCGDCFVCVIGLTLACFHPVMGAVSCVGAVFFLVMLKGGRQAAGWLTFAGKLLLFSAVANPLVNHRGVTMLTKVFHQWITLEAVGYGITSGLMLMAMILWFAYYSVVMTEDKFLYLFGQIAPGSALLITTALQMIPKLKRQLTQIWISQLLLGTKPRTWREKFSAALRHMSTLIGWSMEDAVEQSDSMRARGYGNRRRTTFHLFVFDSRDLRFLLSAVFLVASALPFWFVYDRKRARARDLVPVALMAVLCVVGRTAFALIPLPSFKPVTAIVVVTALAFGPEAGYLTGALAGFLSNFLFGQGPWTPW